jgi:hypothetical protein
MTLHCIGNFEENRYHDSYFWGVYWDDEAQTITKKQIGSTAYGGGIYADTLTTDETVWAAVTAYRAAKAVAREKARRADKAARLLAVRKTFKENGVHTAFMNAYTVSELEEIAALFGKRIRNKFKLSMRENVKAWRPGKYRKPLSPKQFQCIVRPRTDIYGRLNALGRAEELGQMRGMVDDMRMRGIGCK